MENSFIHNLIKEILEESRQNREVVTIAEIFSEDKNGLVRTYDSNTALISPALINKIRPSHINVPVNSNNTSAPLFSLYISPSSGLRKAEPLAVSWNSGNHIALVPNQNFLSSFKLIPRLTSDVTVWDDLSRPRYDIIENKPLSKYEFPHYSPAFVKIHADYLNEYLIFRKKAAVKIFQDIRDVEINEDILTLLAGKKYFIHETKQYEVRINKLSHKENIARIEINGFQVLFNGTDLEEEPNESLPMGHYWKGIEGLVTEHRARHELPFQYVFVSDDVLGKYEEDDDFEVWPESGGVRYGIHWAVSDCERVGKNTIRIELKKLYEGTPWEVISLWNKFSIDPSTINPNEENIVEKAERLIRKYFIFGKLLSDVVNKICDFDTCPAQLIGLEGKSVEYHGLTQHPDIKPITNHVNPDVFSQSQFITRCKFLNALISENLQERQLRKVVQKLGFPDDEIKSFRSLKLLDLVLLN